MRLALAGMAAGLLASGAAAQEPPASEPPAATEPGVISTASDAGVDALIDRRLERIYGQIGVLSRIEVDVVEGVVVLSGLAPDLEAAERARGIAERVQGVVAVENAVETSVDVGERVTPFVERIRSIARRSLNAAPLILLSMAVFAIIAGLGFWIAGWRGLWRKASPNPFVGDLVRQAFRVLGVVLGLVVALNLAGATTLMGAILGGAGVIGIAVGFSVRDTLENYISSIMLSVRQPFRANDLVVIDGNEGKVLRLTSRATVLMTLDGNHLRIPNSTVFKAVILNYTRNPERRLVFDLGVDAADDPQAAIKVGVETLGALDFVLPDPPGDAWIETVGDSNILLRFAAWIDQTETDIFKARTQAIRATKMALESAGFTLPEPIYRLRIDQFPPGSDVRLREPDANAKGASGRSRKIAAPAPDAVSVKPDVHLDQRVSEERRKTGENDLLDPSRPVE